MSGEYQWTKGSDEIGPWWNIWCNIVPRKTRCQHFWFYWEELKHQKIASVELNVKCEDISLIHLFVFTWALKKVQGKNLDDLELCKKPLFIQFHVNNMFCLNTDATPSNRLQIRFCCLFRTNSKFLCHVFKFIFMYMQSLDLAGPLFTVLQWWAMLRLTEQQRYHIPHITYHHISHITTYHILICDIWFSNQSVFETAFIFINLKPRHNQIKSNPNQVKSYQIQMQISWVGWSTSWPGGWTIYILCTQCILCIYTY